MIMLTFTMTKNENISQIHGRGNNTQLASNIPLLAITRPAPPSNILVMRIVILGSIITIFTAIMIYIRIIITLSQWMSSPAPPPRLAQSGNLCGPLCARKSNVYQTPRLHILSDKIFFSPLAYWQQYFLTFVIRVFHILQDKISYHCSLYRHEYICITMTIMTCFLHLKIWYLGVIQSVLGKRQRVRRLGHYG